jgi:hypothetical protein
LLPDFPSSEGGGEGEYGHCLICLQASRLYFASHPGRQDYGEQVSHKFLPLSMTVVSKNTLIFSFYIVIEKPLKTCHCDTCGMINKTCQTNGSCFIQSRLTSLGVSYVQQTCLQPGKDMDFICRYTKDYPYAKCCDHDYCNKDLELMHGASTTTGIRGGSCLTFLNFYV